jgi:hypothetical protein
MSWLHLALDVLPWLLLLGFVITDRILKRQRKRIAALRDSVDAKSVQILEHACETITYACALFGRSEKAEGFEVSRATEQLGFTREDLHNVAISLKPPSSSRPPNG